MVSASGYISRLYNQIVQDIFGTYPLKTYVACTSILTVFAFGTFLKLSLVNKGRIPFRRHDPSLPNNNQIQLCQKCDGRPNSIEIETPNNLKPLRAHHCKVCNKCTPKMDHHCPIISNCVVLNNQKSYLLILGFGFCGISILTFEIMYYMAFYIYPFVIELQSYERIYKGIFYLYIMIAQYVIFAGVASLFFRHLRLAAINATTIEEKGINENVPNPFNLGILYNLKEHCQSFWTCLLPFEKAHKYEGFYFNRAGFDPEDHFLNLEISYISSALKTRTLEDLSAFIKAS